VITPESIADSLIARAGWVCPTCVPVAITVAAGEAGYTIAVTHQRGCGDAATWILAGSGPPPGTHRPPHNPTEGDFA